MGKYKIIENGGREYILVSDVPAYATEYFKAPFGIPSYRSIRHYVTNGVLRRPERVGRETYFKLTYIIGAIAIIRLIRYDATDAQLGRIISNAEKLNKLAEMSELILQARDDLSGTEAWEEFMKQLMVKDPCEINLKKVAEKFPVKYW